MEKEAEQESEQSMRLSDARPLADEQHRICMLGGFQAVFEWKLNRYKQSAAKRYISPIEFAQVYAQLNRKEETLHDLDLAYEQHAPFIAHLQCNPHFDFLRSEPRYRTLVKKMGLPPAF